MLEGAVPSTKKVKMQHGAKDISDEHLVGHARGFFFLKHFSMSDGEEGVLGSLLLTVCSLLLLREW